jgi:UDP-N-acetylglucosamine 2-epimerase (non-hydrolysing)
MAPVIAQLKKKKNVFETIVCITAQHRFMLDQILDVFHIVPDIDLNLMKSNQTLASLTASVSENMDAVLARVKPDIVLIQGDTTTAMTVSLVAYYHKIRVGHIEAGLRTQKKYEPFPEEINRKIISTIADLHFAPSQIAKENLRAEGISDDDIIVTGNTIVDSLLSIKDKLKTKKPILPDDLSKSIEGKRLILVTGHRRENFDSGIQELCGAIKEIVQEYDNVCVVYPVHMNPNVSERVNDSLAGIERVYLIKPLPYSSFLYLMEQSYFILTDSGGVQEEAPTFGKPVLIVRNVTERPEAVTAGNSLLVGTEKRKIVESIRLLLDSPSDYTKMAKTRNIYGNGKASEKIVDALIQYGKKIT